VTLKIRGISNAENLLMGVNKFGHCLTVRLRRARFLRVVLEPIVIRLTPLL